MTAWAARRRFIPGGSAPPVNHLGAGKRDLEDR
jgi:hypothetical protein